MRQRLVSRYSNPHCGACRRVCWLGALMARREASSGQVVSTRRVLVRSRRRLSPLSLSDIVPKQRLTTIRAKYTVALACGVPTRAKGGCHAITGPSVEAASVIRFDRKNLRNDPPKEDP